MPSFQYVIAQPVDFFDAESTYVESDRNNFGYEYRGKWILLSLWLSLRDVARLGASMFGAVIDGVFQDWRGRRSSLAVGSFLLNIGIAIIFVSNLFKNTNLRRGVFFAGEAFQCGASSVVVTTTQTYVSEVLPLSLRGPVLAFPPTAMLLGQLIGAAVIYGCLGIKTGYRIYFALQWSSSAVPLPMAFIIPESPIYLIRKGNFSQALKA